MTKKQEAAIRKAKKIVLGHRNKLFELTQFINSDSLIFAIRLIDMVINEQILFATHSKTKQNAKRSKSTTR